MKELLFAAIDLYKKRCVIIGGGMVAMRKAKKLISCGALVTIVAPAVTDDLAMLAKRGTVTIKKRAYESSDLCGAFLTVIATNEHAVNMRALTDAQDKNILINAAFDKKYGNLFFTATKSSENYTLSAMTKDLSPKKSMDLLERIPVIKVK